MEQFRSTRYAAALCRRPILYAALALGVLAASLSLAMRLALKNDFKELLPADYRSVVALNQFTEKVGGIGSLMVAVECDDYRATQRFITDLAKKLSTLPPRYIRYLDYNIAETKDFFKKNKYLYVDYDDLVTIRERLRKKVAYEKNKRNPLYFDLEEEDVRFDLSDIEKKYQNKTKEADQYLDGFYFNADRKLAALIVRPYGSAAGVGFSKELMAVVRQAIDELSPTRYHPTMRVDFTGKYKTTVVEYYQVIQDVMATLGLCLFFVGLSIYLYFFRLRAILLLTLAVGMGVAATMAATYLVIGYLNSQTAFLGSIIVGNGVNYGIILLARYLEERRRGQTVEPSLQLAIEHTWLPTLASSATTSAAFAALGFSAIKGFSQFGFIGGVGMLLCWLATYTVLPVLLVLSERLFPFSRPKGRLDNQWAGVFRPLGQLVAKKPGTLTAVAAALAAASLIGALAFLPHSLEYDFSKLRNKPPLKKGHTLGDRVEEIFGTHLSPMGMLIPDPKLAPETCQQVLAIDRQQPLPEQTIDSCKTIYSYLPERQPQKLKVLHQIKRLLQDKTIRFADPRYRDEIAKFMKEVDLRPLTIADLPTQIKRNFEELDGTVGRIVFVYPKQGGVLSDGRRLMRLTDALSRVTLSDQSTVSIAGESAIFADLLRVITKDGPWEVLASLFAVFLVVVLSFRRPAAVGYIMASLLLGMLFMLGLQALAGTRLNFFNFIAYPVTFGIGVDYGVNYYARRRQEGAGSTARVIETTGSAIVLCSITTIISYISLLSAMNQALVSFGWMGLMGEFGCILAGIVLAPAILDLWSREGWKKK